MSWWLGHLVILAAGLAVWIGRESAQVLNAKIYLPQAFDKFRKPLGTSYDRRGSVRDNYEYDLLVLRFIFCIALVCTGTSIINLTPGPFTTIIPTWPITITISLQSATR